MSTGKRLAKRSIIGTRVCSRFPNGIYYSGVIQAVKTPSEGNRIVKETNKYTVRFDNVDGIRPVKELLDLDLIGPGFRTVSGCVFQKGQKVFLTYNGREVSGSVVSHSPENDEVVVEISPARYESKKMLRKKLEEVRLLESRKSARLMDQDTDFARLADMAGDRKRTSSHSIDVPSIQGSRKRRPSTNYEERMVEGMSESMAAMALVRLSGSPHSPNIPGLHDYVLPSPGSDIYSWASGGRSPTPSPPLSEGGSSSSYWAQNLTDEGIVVDDDFDELPKKKRTTRSIFRCTWRGCNFITTSVSKIESHVRQKHLGTKEDEVSSDHEEEFYYTEEEEEDPNPAIPAVHPHKDMCRPSHEDPDLLKSPRGSFPLLSSSSGCSSFSSSSSSSSSANVWSSSTTSTQKLAKLNGFSHDWATTTLSASAPTRMSPATLKGPASPTRKPRGDTKKCRKVYGMEHRELWCTQCKWKKACTRFSD